MTQILNRWNAAVIAEGEMNLRELVLREVGSRADLRGADLSDADLSDADLRGADLRGADLRGADLSDADLSRANLSRADLRGADLRGADLDYSSWPLRCSSLKARVCDKISAQLLFHAFAVSAVIPTDEQVEFMRVNFHRFVECGGVDTITVKPEMEVTA